VSATQPKNLLPAKPAVKSLDDVERALAEIKWLDQESARIVLDYETRIDALCFERDQKLIVDKKLGGGSFDERRAALTEAVIQYAEKNRDDLLDGIEGKTRELEAGSITFRNIADKLVPRSADKTLDQVLDEFLKKHKVKPAIDELLNGELVPEVRIGDLVSIRYSWNQSYAKAALDKKTLNAKSLPLKLEKQPEQITVNVGE